MFAAPPSFPSLFSLQYLRFISMFDNCILCCSSRVPFQLRCPFKTDFSSRSKRGFVLPIHRFLAIHAISMHFLLSHSFFPTSKRERERSHFEWRIYPRIEFFFSLFLRDPWRKREEIEKPSHNNSGKTLQVKAYEKKKKNCIFFITFGGRYSKRWRRPSERDREKRSCWIEDSYYTPSGQYNETIVVRRAA